MKVHKTGISLSCLGLSPSWSCHGHVMVMFTDSSNPTCGRQIATVPNDLSKMDAANPPQMIYMALALQLPTPRAEIFHHWDLTNSAILKEINITALPGTRFLRFNP